MIIMSLVVQKLKRKKKRESRETDWVKSNDLFVTSNKFLYHVIT